jgi:uncharacterized protein YjbK
MGTGQEVELKLRVSDYEALKKVAAASGANLDALTPAQQTNHFFDSPDLRLRQARYAVRLRQEDHRFILTVKGAHPDAEFGSALAIRIEEETDVPPAEAQSMIDGVLSPLAFFRLRVDAEEGEAAQRRQMLVRRLFDVLGEGTLKRLGQFSNRRWRAPVEILGANLELEFDEATFPGHIVHHEVELEFPRDLGTDEVEAAFRGLFDKAGVEGNQAPGKATRFFAAISGLAVP